MNTVQASFDHHEYTSNSSEAIFLCYPDNRQILNGARAIPRPSSSGGFSLIALAFCLLILAALVNVQLSIVHSILACFGPSSDQNVFVCLFSVDHLFGSLISIALFLFLVYFIFLGIREVWQDSVFHKRNAVLIYGKVINAHIKHSRDDGDTLVVRYMFSTPNHSIIKAKTSVLASSA